MLQIKVTLPRDDEKRFTDLLHLNGYVCTVERPVDEPVTVTIRLQAEQVLDDEARLVTRSGIAAC